MQKKSFITNWKYINIYSLLFILILISCNSNNKVKIGVMLPNMVDDRCPKEKAFISAKLNELGGEAIVADGQNNDQLQITQAEELLDKGVKVLIVMAVNKNTAALIVRNAHKRDVKVIAYERIISNCDLDYYVSFDNVKVGELMASYALKLKPEGNYFLMGGDKFDQNAIWVKEGWLNILGPSIKLGKIKIIYDTFIEDWSGENAYFETKRYLNLSGIVPDAIISAYDGMSTGAINALVDNNVGQFPIITGQNAELQACRNVVSGKQAMTIYKPLKLEAEMAADLAVKCAKNEKIEKTSKTNFNGAINVPSFLINPISVDASNMKNTVISDGFLKETDVYGN